MPIVAIPGITGAQQTAIAHAFAAHGWTVRAGSRSVQDTPFGPTQRVDFDQSASLAAFLDGVDVLAFTVPQDHSAGAMVGYAETLATAASASGVGRIVMNLATRRFPEATGPLFDDLRAACAAVEAATPRSVVLEPTVFMDNLVAPWSAAAIVNAGVLSYAAARHAPIGWMSHRSLAEAAVAVALHPDPDSNYCIGGPAIDGDQLAAVLAHRLDRPVDYQEMLLDGFAAAMDAALGVPTGARLRSLYDHINPNPGVLADGADVMRARDRAGDICRLRRAHRLGRAGA